MKAYLLRYKTKDRKFYSIEVRGRELLTKKGNYGTETKTITKQYASPEIAEKEAHSLIRQHETQGYIEMIEEGDVIRDEHFFAGKFVQDIEWPLESEPDRLIDITYALRFSGRYFPPIVEQLKHLARRPYRDLIDNLVIGDWDNRDNEDSIESTVNQLAKSARFFPGLKHLFLGWTDYQISWIKQTDYSDFYSHYPQLESFGVKGDERLKLGNIDLPKLKHLIIQTHRLNADNVKDICDSDLPNLEYLELWLGAPEYWSTRSPAEVHDLQDILNGKFPKLNYLGLKNYYKQDELIKALQEASILDNLKVLDISMGKLTDEGAEALYNNDRLLNLEHINCRHHFISPEWQDKLKKKFAQQNINLDRYHEKEDDDGNQSYVDAYYVQVGE